ncbi:MAG: Gfo/Idh/MocA family protein [Halanaerobiales bacterium]
MTQNRLNIGIIGTGRMGTARAEVLNRLGQADIGWVCSRSKSRGKEFAKKYNIDRVITSWKKGCKDAKIDAVIITSPNSLHEKMTVKALNAGKHVLLEYPMEINTKKANNILNKAKASQGKLQIGLTYRITAKHQAIRKYINKLGKIGTCITVQCSGKKISRWFDDKAKVGNVIIGSNFHFVDELIDWFGPVKWVDADIHEDLEEGNKNKVKRDIGSVMLKFNKGISAYIIYARGYESPGLGFERKIIGEKGYIVENNGKPEYWSPEGKKEINYEGNKDSILEDTRMFINYILGKRDLLYTPEDGVYGVKVVEAASRAAKQGKRIYL